jgi:hypothetical protein
MVRGSRRHVRHQLGYEPAPERGFAEAKRVRKHIQLEAFAASQVHDEKGRGC